MLMGQMNHQLDPAATPATVLGPIHIEGSPELGFGTDMCEGLSGTPVYVHGRGTDLDGKPVARAVLDVWQADTEGLYDLPETPVRVRRPCPARRSPCGAG